MHPSAIFIVFGLLVILFTSNPTTIVTGSLNAAGAGMFIFGLIWGSLAFGKSRRKKPDSAK